MVLRLLLICVLLTFFILSDLLINASISQQCIPDWPCAINKECGEHGVCIDGKGTKVCICTCTNFLPCSTDLQCGNLSGACDRQHFLCNCAAAYRTHGFASIVDVEKNLCGKKPCLNKNDCFGTLCATVGLCRCYKG